MLFAIISTNSYTYYIETQLKVKITFFFTVYDLCSVIIVSVTKCALLILVAKIIIWVSY